MKFFNLEREGYSSIQDAINAIPAEETHLCVESDVLDELSGDDLIALLGIPTSVTHLDLCVSYLDELSRDSLTALLSGIPESVKYLSLGAELGDSELDDLSGAQLAVAFASIPRSVTSLDLRCNSLGGLSGAELAVAFASIPVSVTHLNLSINSLCERSGAELVAAFARIPAGVTHLYLSANALGQLSGAELAAAFASIPVSVTHLDLSRNRLDQRPGADLAVVFASILKSVTSLDLGWNNLDKLSVAGLAKLLASIPNTVKEVKLANNALTSKSEAYLKEAFSGLPKETVISFRGRKIFTPGNRQANDALLKKLGKAAAGRSLCFTNTGESDLVRAMSILVGLSQQVVPVGLNNQALDYTTYTRMPLSVIHHIASFLVSPKQSQDLSTLLESSIMTAVMGRQSENSYQKASIVNTLDLSKEGLRCLLAPQLQAIFEEIPQHIRKVILSDIDVERMSVEKLSAALRCLNPKMIIKLTTNDQALLAKLLDVAEGLGLRVEKKLRTPCSMFNTGLVGSNKRLCKDPINSCKRFRS